ncbi:hypothetical protein AAKU55_003275 [Oxalobacteraceae bacterium GrIS 1.11]
MKILSLPAAVMTASLICLTLSQAPHAQAASGGHARKSCYKQVFKKTVDDTTWIVKECAENGRAHFQVAFENPISGAQTASFTEFDADGDALTKLNYVPLSATTLLVNMALEGGGWAVLLHPVRRSDTLSAARFDYQARDSLHIKQDGNMIHASTEYDDIILSVDVPGTLRMVRTVKK